MQFVSLKDSPALDYIEFFRTKFPLAYKQSSEDNDDEPTEWITDAHEKDFKAFETQMVKVAKDKSCLSLL
jgi:hypothetical protein